MKTTSLFIFSAALFGITAASCSASNGHRRHHGKTAKKPLLKPASNAAAKNATVSAYGKSGSTHSNATSTYASDSDTYSATSSASTSSSTAKASAGSSNSTSYGLTTSHARKNGVYVGWLPDDGDAGGSSQTMASINTALGSMSAAYGYYAQARSGTTFDGGQLLSRWDDIVNSGAVFQPAVMPTGGWQGLTYNDNSQAVNIANVMKKFTDAGVTVWLRFGHEMNWYQTDGTYQGTASDFKEGWSVVAQAMRDIAPEVKMWFTPNVASEDQYDEYFPDDSSSVDLIGIDFYPQSVGSTTFLDTMKSFHDKYTSDSIKFAIGETGLGASASMSDRLAWLQQITSEDVANAMPNFIATSWFNYYKGYDFRLAAVSGDSITASYLG